MSPVRARLAARCAAAAVGLVADRLAGEPPARLHPVAWLGRGLRRAEERWWRDTRLAGARHAGLGVACGLAGGWALRRATGQGAATALAVGVAVAGRALAEEAARVGGALEQGDLPAARALVPALVGRDPTALDHKELARAVVESVAENTVDAVVAPALWGAVAGAPGALAYRAVNTLDAMVGHRSPRYERFGWASARLDDVAGWVPARVCGGLVALARPASAPEVWRAVRRDAGGHPSPNAGVAEAAFAAALGLRLGGINRYGERVELRPPLGTGRPAEGEDIGRAVDLSRDVTLMLAGLLLGLGVALG